MYRKLPLYVMGVSILLATPQLTRAQDGGWRQAIVDMEKGSLQDRARAAAAISTEIKELKEALLKLAEVEPEKWIVKENRMLALYEDKHPRMLAIQLLGDLHCIEAVPFLMKNITLFFPHKMGDSFDSFASAKVLIKIGMPSIDAITKSLGEEKSKTEMSVFSQVIKQVVGEKVGREILLNAKPRFPSNSRRQANLNALLEYFK